VQRDSAAETAFFTNHGKTSSVAPIANPASVKANTVQGVYLIVNDKGTLRTKFVPVSTGITGTTDIEVLSGLKEGDEVVTGRYKVLRILKSGTSVKRDTAPLTAASTDDSSS